MAVIVALTDPAIDAALRWRDALWPGVPGARASRARTTTPRASSAPQATTIRVHVDPAATLRTALALLPETTNVAIVGGAEARGRLASTLRRPRERSTGA